ncbi:hypothetical protein GGR57DRAFT_482787 [Xylariaceae sp. FL1272]|nr:hypothetical protein GGR57DRAFT_482787 [Xylariaceae sp. FL1272]
MPMISSPVVYPASSSPTSAKRSKPHTNLQSRLRTKAGFLLDDSDDEDALPVPAAKRQMLSSPGDAAPAKYTEPSSPPPRPLNLNAKTSDAVSSTEDVPRPNDEPKTQSQALPSLLLSGSNSFFNRASAIVPQDALKITTCSGDTVDIAKREPPTGVSYERMVAARSRTKKGRAERSYYGIDIHELIDEVSKDLAGEADKPAPVPDEALPSVEHQTLKKPKKTLLWTEKYRARNFMDLVGDDLTNRQVLKWLKRWDSLVFPGASKSRPSYRRPGVKAEAEEEQAHRKILLLTGPPGLGKTTLAHVCAKQAGYEVMEINASDDRSRDVVKNRIRTSLATESVKTVQHSKVQSDKPQKVARPVCVVVDEVDGVVTGSGASGEGGFIKALMDLITTGEKNASGQDPSAQQGGKRKKKGDDFRQMRPLILICNDVYHPSLRPLRQSSLAEIIHVGKPTVDSVINRLKSVFEKEGIPCEKDAARKICESAWGITGGIDTKRGAQSTTEGDLRGIMVVGEWVAGRLRSSVLNSPLSLTRQWVEQHVVSDLAHGGGGARGVGRGNVKDIVTRVFQDGAGFPKNNIPILAPSTKHLHEQPQAQLGFSEQQKKYGIERLQQMVETSGDMDRVLTEIYSEYPSREFNDDSFLSKPNQAYEWMHFHDTCSSRIFGSQEWELGPYLCQPILACHHLFASPIRRANMGFDKRWGNEGEEEAPPLPFSGPRADFAARESEKENRSMLQALQAQLPPTLMRSFRSAEDVSAEFLPYLIRMVSPDVKPVVVGGSGDSRGTASVRKDTEKAMVQRAANVLAEVGIELQRGKIESESPFSRGPQWVYRMEPDLDVLSTYETSAAILHGTQAPTRYAVRQVLDQELQKATILRENAARQARYKAGSHTSADYIFDDKENTAAAKKTPLPEIPVKRDFFGRIIKPEARPLAETDGNGATKGSEPLGKAETKVWVTYHEGLNNAVRKPVTLDELLRSL